ncbi:molybdenum cofactor guanylyltransferase [Virgibacillus ndiopensis]|uniref:molybdenum cofactor guanylyltransferase n=1 Tax=Virgibacillus ndiopensis TaxID=2004408 RepID=UPI000C085CAC|nr:molybdenum cofactor guanylyltransferase [Virgibacillus ndiopensis]
MNSCGVILSGGKSSRMGKTKSLLPLHNKSVIEHIALELSKFVDDLVVATNEPAKYTFLGLPMFTDRYTNKGPLAGIETGIYHTNADFYFFAACDMPFINQQVYNFLVDQLKDFDAVIPVYENTMHPLTGIYKRSVLPNIQQQLDRDDRKVKKLFDYINVNYVSHYDTISDEILQRHFFNMNYPAQYEQAKIL